MVSCRWPSLILLFAFAFVPVAISETAALIPQASDSSPKASGSLAGLEMLSDPEGLDWNEYVHHVYLAVKKKFTTTELPDSAKKGEEGTVRVEFQIQRDGQILEDSLFLIGSSKKDMDDVCLGAIKGAAPYQHLPDTFRGPSIKLRLTFYFNVPKAAQPLPNGSKH